MKKVSDLMTISPSLHQANTYYIFRENGCEVKVEIIGNFVKSDKKLLPEENDYFYDYFLKRERKTKVK